ncbi:Gfo/Idh/MocA family protein [Microbacterium sp. R86528]|uniref:Gfo/Idh/MocA family protein n=1 Tax=Microbacterium sp. R86528 TaxID=3093864 RepID=UPI0037C57CE9
MADSRRTRWAILGPGRISHDFAQSLTRSAHGSLQAVGSSSPKRAREFSDTYGAPGSGTYREVIDRDDVDAVYIGTVHTTHAELAIAALNAGKPVLCEKPASIDGAGAAEVIATARRVELPFLEAYKYRFGPLAQELRRIVSSGEIGLPLSLSAPYGFAARDRSSRLFSAAVGGGAILDVGCYPVSMAVGIAHWAGKAGMVAEASLSSTGAEMKARIDESAEAEVRIGSLTAQVETSIVRALPTRLVIRGTEGWFESDQMWGSRSASGTTAVVYREGRQGRPISVSSVDPLAAEADAVSRAIADGRSELPEVTWGETVAIAQLLDDWRRQVSEPAESSQ